MVSFCVAMPFLFGAYVIGGGVYLLGLFSLAAFFANTGREVTKGIVDVEGDVVRNVMTVARVYGFRMAALVSFVFYLLAVAVGFVPLALGLVSWLYIPFFVVSCLGFLLDSMFLVKYADRVVALKVKRRVLVYMLLAMVAVFVGGFSVYWGW